MLLPLSPKILSSIMERTAFLASSLVAAIITPFPSASPSALITVGTGQVSMYLSALSISPNTSYSAVGIPYFFIRFLEKTLLPSIIAASLEGPKQGTPILRRASAMPRTSGSSGVTTQKSMPCVFANSTAEGISVAEILTHSASFAMPPLPGKAYILVIFLFSLSFFITACSRPPPPITIMFIFSPHQWWKRRMPVKDITMPFLLQVSITISSLMEPPGCAT